MRAHAWVLAKANGGAAGVDGMTFAEIEAAGAQEWLAGARVVEDARDAEPHEAGPEDYDAFDGLSVLCHGESFADPGVAVTAR